MKNTTDHSTGTTPWVTRPEPASDPSRTREMPLLFQLADVNRLPPVPAQSPAGAVSTAAMPAPIEMPLGSAFNTSAFQHSPTTSSGTPFPIKTSTFSDPWPPTPTGLFEMNGGLSTAALAMSVNARSQEAATREARAEAPKPTPAMPSSEPAVAEAKSADAKKSEPKADESKSVAAPASETKSTSAPALSSLPAAIDIAVKAAAVEQAVAEVKAEARPVAKSDAKLDSKSAATAAPSTTSADVESKTEAGAAAANKPSPGSVRRQRAEARQQKVEGKKSNDWLHSHGKIIAIGFVIALFGTIYLARRNQHSAKELANPQAEPPMGLAIEVPESGDHEHHHHPAEAANTAPKLVEAPSHPLDPTPSPAHPDAISPEASSPAPSATADLHPPMIPADSKPAASNEPLFPWQQGDARMATRPDAPVASPAPAAGATTPTAPTGGPTLNGPQYPETNLRDAPLLPPAPPEEQGRTRAPSRTSPASFTSTPGGNRYERTGSGLY